jgi:hypothetical protein
MHGVQAPEAEQGRSRAPRWAAAASVLLLLLQCAAFHGVRKDDAFITYRYGQNLALGRGLVFNPGEHIMGSTSPGHVLLSAVTYAVVGKAALPAAMACWGCAGWIMQVLAIGLLLQRVASRPVAWLVAAAVALGGAGSAAFVSLETNWVAAMLLWAIEFAIARRWLRCAATLACAVIFRPDMMLAAVLLGALCVWEARATALRAALLFCALVAPWYAFALTYFGRVTPQSASAKYQRTSWLEYAVFEFKHPAATASPLDGDIVGVLSVWMLVAFGALTLVRRDRRYAVLPVYLALHMAAYSYLRPYMHAWHLYPATLLVVVLALFGLSAIGGHMRSRLPARVALAAIGLLGLCYAERSVRFAFGQSNDPRFGARDRAYQDIASYLRAHARPSDVVASVEVGTIAYYTDLTMYDWGALVTPHPVLRPDTPRLSWTVVDDSFQDRFASAMTPVRRFQVGEFGANVYSFDLMQAAVGSLLAQPRSAANPAGLQRADVDRRLSELSGALDHSGQRIDVFLDRLSGKP